MIQFYHARLAAMPLRPISPGAGRGHAAAGHQGVSLMGLGNPGRLRVDQPTITGELRPAPDAYTHYSPVMIAALSKDCRPERFWWRRGLFFCSAGRTGRIGSPVRPRL